MKIIKALFGAMVITIISCLLLTITIGVPTKRQLLWHGGEMFGVAFIIFLAYDPSEKQS